MDHNIRLKNELSLTAKYRIKLENYLVNCESIQVVLNVFFLYCTRLIAVDFRIEIRCWWEFLQGTDYDRINTSQHFSSEFFIGSPCRFILCSKSLIVPLQYNNGLQNARLLLITVHKDLIYVAPSLQNERMSIWCQTLTHVVTFIHF